MPTNTPNLNLYKVNGETDGNDTFNVDVVLNDNWDKIDKAIKEVEEGLDNVSVPDASLDHKGIVQLSNATNGTREDVAATEKAVKTAESNAKTYVDNKSWQKAKLTHDAGVSLNISNQDLDSIVTVGFYSGENLKNAPTTQVGRWYHIKVEAMAEGYVMQTASELNTTAPSFYMRVKVGTWGAWSADLFQSGADAKQGIVNALSALGIAATTSETWASLIVKFQVGKVYGPGNEVPVEQLEFGAVPPTNGFKIFSPLNWGVPPDTMRGEALFIDRKRNRLVYFGGGYSINILDLSTGANVYTNSTGGETLSASYDESTGIIYYAVWSSTNGVNQVYKCNVSDGGGNALIASAMNGYKATKIIADKAGGFYIISRNYLCRYNSNGQVVWGFSPQDYIGTSLGASYYTERGLTLGADGYLYAMIYFGSDSLIRIVKIMKEFGAKLQLAGTNTYVVASKAIELKVDASGYVWYIGSNYALYLMTPAGVVQAVDASTTYGNVQSIDIDSAGNCYVLMYNNQAATIAKYKNTSGTTEILWAMSGITDAYPGTAVKIEANTDAKPNTVHFFTNVKSSARYIYEYKQTLKLLVNTR